MADRLPAIDTTRPVGQRFPPVVREEIAALAAGNAPVQSVNGRTGVITLDKTDVGLDEVDNTADADKPISNAVSTALGDKLNSSEVSAAATANTVPRRDASGRMKAADPNVASDVATRGWVEAVTAGGVPDGGITTAKLADDAVTQAKIADEAVGSAQLAVNSVGGYQISDNAVGQTELASNAVITAKINDSAVTAAKLASNAVTTVKILDANVTLAKLAADSVNSSKIVDGSVAKTDLVTAVQTSLDKADAAVAGNGLSLVVQAGAPSGAPSSRVTIRTS
ncbi:hypothetical protein SEA_MOSSROSE_38 [Gordonia phage MossRose]|nr:hypothetical protein SEA_MOSSROSE_38 [Gordonia phage MossRose]